MNTNSRRSAFGAPLTVIAGVVIAMSAWWLIERFTNEAAVRLARGVGPDSGSITHLLLITALVGAAATWVLTRSKIMLAAATATFAVLVILGGYGYRTPLVTLPSVEIHFTLLRGSYTSPMWVLLGAWTALLVHKPLRKREAGL